jgi:hypothetical protein
VRRYHTPLKRPANSHVLFLILLGLTNLNILTLLMALAISILPDLLHSHPQTLDTVRGRERGIVVPRLASDVPSVDRRWT